MRNGQPGESADAQEAHPTRVLWRELGKAEGAACEVCRVMCCASNSGIYTNLPPEYSAELSRTFTHRLIQRYNMLFSASRL